MYNLGDRFKPDYSKSKSAVESIFKGNKYRITVLTERLIRLEYNENGVLYFFQALKDKGKRKQVFGQKGDAKENGLEKSEKDAVHPPRRMHGPHPGFRDGTGGSARLRDSSGRCLI